MHQRYDVGSKWLIHNHADAILRLAGVAGVESWAPLPGELVQSRQLPDGLIEARVAGHPDPVLFVIEINTYPENRVAGELLDDALLTYLNYRRVPEVVVVLLRPRGRVVVPDRLTLAAPLGGTELTVRWRVVELWTLPAADLLPLADPGLAPWVTLMRIDGDPAEVLQHRRDVIEFEPEPGRKATLLGVIQVLASLRYDKDMLKALFGRSGAVIESPILLDWKAEIQQDMVLSVLRDRFGVVPADVVAGLQLVTDEAIITRLIREACAAPTLDAFRAALAPPA